MQEYVISAYYITYSYLHNMYFIRLDYVRTYQSFAPLGQCGGIQGDLTSLKDNFPYREANFLVKSPTSPLLQCGV